MCHHSSNTYLFRYILRIAVKIKKCKNGNYVTNKYLKNVTGIYIMRMEFTCRLKSILTVYLMTNWETEMLEIFTKLINFKDLDFIFTLNHVNQSFSIYLSYIQYRYKCLYKSRT